MRTPEEIDRAIGLVWRVVATRQLLPVPGGFEVNERMKKVWEVLSWVKGESVDFEKVLTLLEENEAAPVGSTTP